MQKHEQQDLVFTKNYDLFELYEENRDYENHKDHIHKLARSMGKHGFLKSQRIIVQNIPGSEKLAIFDGQHRVIAARIAGIGLWYTIDNTLKKEALADVQISKPWDPKDYIKNHSVLGNVNYTILKEVQEMFPAAPPTAIGRLLAGKEENNWDVDAYNDGLFVVTKQKQTIALLEKAKELFDITHHHWIWSIKFLMAYAVITKIKGYDQKHFVYRLKNGHIDEFIQQRNTETYHEMIGLIYNWRLLAKNRLNFDYLPPKKRAERDSKE